MSIQTLSGTAYVNSGRRAQAGKLTALRFVLRRRLEAFEKYRALRKAWAIDRQAFQHVLYLDDRILEDMGVTRADVLLANKLPLRINAALELRKTARTSLHPAHRRTASSMGE